MGSSLDATLLTAIAAELQEHPTEDATVADVLDRAVGLLPADHASLTVRRRHVGWDTAGATSTVAVRADELQYAFDEGPCVEAYAAADRRSSDRVADDPRWPRWGPAAEELGLRSVLSLGLEARGERVGSLNLYASTPAGFADPAVAELARLYAVHASYALHSARRRAGLESAIGSRHVIGVAQGMLAERFGLDLERSFALLQRLSSTHNRKLRDICEELVRTGDTTGLGAGPMADD